MPATRRRRGYRDAVATSLDAIRAQLTAAERELRAHLASWEYAFAMGDTQHGGGAHPRHRATRERTDHLVRRRDDLRARLAEHDV